MATARITCTLPPNIDVTEAPLAFGKRGIPKLNEELSNKSLIIRQRALMTLCDLAHIPERIYEAIRTGKQLLLGLTSIVLITIIFVTNVVFP